MMDDLACSVAELLRMAGDDIIVPRHGRLLDRDIDTKSAPNDLVTIADHEAEAWLTPRLKDIVEAVVIGEEACAAAPELRQRAGETVAWTVDPVDGTGNFVKGNDRFCSMVSLLQKGVPLRSWIWLPLSEELYYASAGEGAVCLCAGDGEPRPLSVGAGEGQPGHQQSGSNRPENLSGGANVGGVAEPLRTLMRDRLRAMPNRCFPGSTGILGTSIASGSLDFLLHGTCTPWDHAPVDLLCREAGAHAGMVSGGHAYNAASAGAFMIAPNPQSWQALHTYLTGG